MTKRLKQMVKSLSTEQKIIEAARKVFIHKGMAGARMQEIADEAGINKALLHYYFRSKDKLFDKIFIEAFRTITAGVDKVLYSKGAILDKLKRFIDLYIDVLIANPYLPVFVLGELNQNPGRLQKIVEEDISSLMVSFVNEFMQQLNSEELTPVHPVHFMLNIMGMLLFPFIARPLVAPILQKNIGIDFDLVINQRKEEVYKFVIQALTPKNKQ